MALRFTVGEVPRTKPFQFADLAELTILVGRSRQVSKADLDGLIEMGGMDSDPDPEMDGRADPIDIAALHSRNAEDCFRQLTYRSGALDEHYPFHCKGALLSPKDRVTDAGYLYLFCLICSRLASFSGETGFSQRCAKIFTELSKSVLRFSLNGSAEVYVFDAGSDDRRDHFHTNLKDALKVLAAKLNAYPATNVIEQQSSSGDAGIDLVAINRLGDGALGVLAYFAQSAAQMTGWPKKSLEPRKSGIFFTMGHLPMNLLCTPVLYRNATGSWVNDLHSQDCVIFDRLRVMSALKQVTHEIPAAVFNQIRAVVDQVSSARTD